jgi:hypothetical protein
VNGSSPASLLRCADFLEISEATLNNWKQEHPKFLESIKRGKLQADATVAKSLYHRACGYSHKAVKIFQHGGQTIEHEYIERYPPDTAAAIIWLKNRRPQEWRDRMEVASLLKLDPKSLTPAQVEVMMRAYVAQFVGDDSALLNQAMKELEAGTLVVELKTDPSQPSVELNGPAHVVDTAPAAAVDQRKPIVDPPAAPERKKEHWEP